MFDSFFQKHSSTVKIMIIAVVALLMLIPLSMIQDLIKDRQQSYELTTDEVGKMWSLSQTIAGPVINIPVIEKDEDENGRVFLSKSFSAVNPESLLIMGEINTEILHKSIYDVVVFRSLVDINGVFEIPVKAFSKMDGEDVTISLTISDLRGIEEKVILTFAGEQYEMSTGSADGVIQTKINKSKLSEGQSYPYSLSLKLKGSNSLKFAPMGEITNVDLTSGYKSPAFCGDFLPEKRIVDENGFSAHWKVLAMNRNNPEKETFGVELLIPVTQYQQAMRAVKYGILIILLVFVAAYLVEISTKKEICLLQYLLIGLALVLFYTLLLSISEFLSFGYSYLIASSMTILLLGGYFVGILRSRHAYYIILLLILLYAFIYMLLQMEAYALLAGSLGLFLILGIIMYFTSNIIQAPHPVSS